MNKNRVLKKKNRRVLGEEWALLVDVLDGLGVYVIETRRTGSISSKEANAMRQSNEESRKG